MRTWSKYVSSNHRQVRPSASCVLAALLLMVFAIARPTPVTATTIYWDGSGTGWNSTASWSTNSGATTPDPAAVPGIGDDVVFNITTVNTNQTVNLNGGGNSNSQSANSLLFRSTGTVLIQEGGDSAGHTFTIGGGGLTINSGAGAVTIGGTAANGKQDVGIIINANQNWANNSSNILTIQNTVTSNATAGTYTLSLTGSGSGGIAFNDALSDGGPGVLALTVSTTGGVTTLNKAGSYTGLTNITSGTLTEGVSNAIGSGAVTVNGSTAILNLGTNHNDTVGTVTLAGGGSINGTGTSTLTSTGTFEMQSGSASAILAGSVALNKTTSGTVTLTGANTYTGATSIGAGILNIQNATALGTTAAGTSVSSGATLQIQGGITVGNEALTISGTGASGQNGALVNVTGTNNYGGLVTLGAASTISSDSGTLNLTNAGTITGSGFGLTLTGSGNGSVSSIIGTTSGTLTKSGSGTWTLTGANTYTGATTINNGTLNANGTSTNQALGGTSGVSVNGSGSILQLGNNNQINNAAGLTLNGGTFNLGGKSEGAAGTTGLGALSLTSTSTIDFAIGTFSSVVQFAGVGTHTASTILQMINWNGTIALGGGSERLLFAGNSTDFLSAYSQSDVSFNGVVGYNAIQFSGYYEITEVPEPSTWIAGALALGAIGFSQRRRLARVCARAS